MHTIRAVAAGSLVAALVATHAFAGGPVIVTVAGVNRPADTKDALQLLGPTGAGLACILHAILPAMCESSCSRAIASLQRLFADRNRMTEVTAENSALLTFVRPLGELDLRDELRLYIMQATG